MRPLPHRLALLLLSVIGLAFAVPARAAGSRPNIVVILADDYGYGSANCYGADGKLIRTPNIDRLAKEGRRFTDANTTSSVCSPTRYSLLTGRYCWRTSLKSGVLNTFAPLHIEPSRLTVASLLKKEGYSTAAIGKWHLGYGAAGDAAKYRADYTGELRPGPKEVGFDYHFGVPSNHGDLTGVYVENAFVYGIRSGKIPAGMTLPGPRPDSDNYQATYKTEDTESGKNEPVAIDAPRRKNVAVMEEVGDKAVGWIGRQKADVPFFLYYTPVAVHNPVTPAADIADRSAAGPYGDWIHELDRAVGRILDALDKNGLADNTLVIFTSDNGGVKVPSRDTAQTQALKAGLAVNGNLRGGKHSVWQGGFQVPFLVRWPGKVPAGTTCDTTVSLADLLATTAAIVDVPLPPASQAAEDSYNILPAMLGQSTEPIRRDIIVHSSDGVFAIRKGPWKYVEGVPVPGIPAAVQKTRAEEFKPQLYNLVDDPAETKDLKAAHAEIVAELKSLLDRYRDGAYSRELPPAAEKPSAVAVPALPDAANKTLIVESFDQALKKPWVEVRGTWQHRDGAIWGSQAMAEKQGAAIRVGATFGDADLTYKVSLPSTATHTLRLQCEERTHVVRVDLSTRQVEVLKQIAIVAGKAAAPEVKPGADAAPPKGTDDAPPKSGGATTIGSAKVNVTPGQWTSVRVSLRGRSIYVTVGNTVLKVDDDWVAEKKTIVTLMALGKDVGFDAFELKAAP